MNFRQLRMQMQEIPGQMQKWEIVKELIKVIYPLKLNITYMLHSEILASLNFNKN